MRAAYVYSGPAKDVVHRFKYEGMSAAAGWMAERMCSACRLNEGILVPVPLHPRREKSRGYNQAELLAREISRRRGMRVVLALERSSFRQAQALLGAEERWLNVEGAFHPRSGVRVEEPVTLIDDVCTTGATMEACAAALARMGAPSVSGLVFART